MKSLGLHPRRDRIGNVSVQTHSWKVPKHAFQLNKKANLRAERHHRKNIFLVLRGPGGGPRNLCEAESTS